MFSSKARVGDQDNNLFVKAKTALIRSQLNVLKYFPDRKKHEAERKRHRRRPKFRKRHRRSTFITEEEYIVRTRVIKIIEEEEFEYSNGEPEDRSKANNNKTGEKLKNRYNCFHTCFESRSQTSEEFTPIINVILSKSVDDLRSYKIGSCALNMSEITGYKDVFLENSENSKFTLRARKIHKDLENRGADEEKSLSIARLVSGTPLASQKKVLDQIEKDELSTRKSMESYKIGKTKTVDKDSEKVSKPDFDEISVNWMNCSLLDSKYSCNGYIGRGTFGKVFSCSDLKQNSVKVAIKVNNKLEKYRKLAIHEISLLNKVKKNDPAGKNFIVILNDWLDINGHIFLIFPEYGENLYKYLKYHNRIGIQLTDVRQMSLQLLKAVKFLHSLTIIHTDIKPENLLLVSKDYRSENMGPPETKFKLAIKSDIVLIDLGNGVSDRDTRPKMVVTRYYRPPEVYLGLGWDQSLDVWSIGCVMFELYTGKSLFQCKGDIEHLWMMQYVLKKFPDRMLSKSKLRDTFFDLHGDVLTVNVDVYKMRIRMQQYEDFMDDKKEGLKSFDEVIKRCLRFNPRERITPQEALLLPFFS